MEMLDIVDENGAPLGIVKERTKVHEDGDLHRTSHVWIVRDNKNNGIDVLLQKRSKNKDSFPDCYDISSAGHIPAGQDYLESAVRELKEELGIDIEADKLEYRGTRRISMKNIFYGKQFVDNQVTHVYRLKINNLDVEKLNLQVEEVQSVIWMDYEECIKAVKNNTIKHCVYDKELELIR